MESRPIWQWSAVETAAAIKAGRASAEQVTTAHIDRLHAANPALNAVVVDMGDLALGAARAADDAAKVLGSRIEHRSGNRLTVGRPRNAVFN